jgi:NAD(P)-dependent dehydrogenase (short-subunit alcohol dehydrogenase family)
MELANQTALITGGTAGIGAEAARLFAREGARVIISGRNAERGAKAVADIGSDVRFIQADLGDLDSVKQLAAQAGPVDVLVNNAASFPTGMTVDQDVASFQAMFDTNVRGTYFLTAALVPAMLANQRGSIVNVTTMAASMGVAGASGCSATKAALASFTRTWAAEFSPHGVRVNTIAPAPTRTEGVLIEWGESIEDLAQALPMARTARPARRRPSCRKRSRRSSPGMRQGDDQPPFRLMGGRIRKSRAQGAVRR